MYKQALQNEKAVEAAAIPVENTSGPILCYSATGDELWPSTLMCNQVMERLDQKGFPFYHEHISHDYGHGWCGETCLAKILDFLGEYFR